MDRSDAAEVVRRTRYMPLGRRAIDAGNADGRYFNVDDEYRAVAAPVEDGATPAQEPDPPGIVFLDPEQIHEFRSRPARRVTVSCPAGKPYVIRLSNGDMLTAYTHNYVADLARLSREGYHTQVRWSADGGETWSAPVCPFSRDHGRTWSKPWSFDVSRMFGRGLAYSNRSHVPHPDGSVTLFFSNFYAEPYQTWGCVSRDGGRTHDEYWFVGEHIGDQSFLGLGGDAMLAAFRIYGEIVPDKSALPYGYHPLWSKGGGGGEAHDYIAVSRSGDGGRTWSSCEPVTG